MARSLGKQNPELTHALLELRRAARANDAPIWSAVADRLERSRHQFSPVNVGHLARAAGGNEAIVVPGKLLSSGSLSRPLTVGVFDCSETARAKVHAAGGKVLTIHEMLMWRPDGAGVRIVS